VFFLSRQNNKKLFHVQSHPRTLFYDSEDSDAHYNDFQYWKDSLSNVEEEDVRSVTAGDGERRQRRRRKRPATKRRPVRPPVFGLTSEEEEEGEGDEKRDEMEEEVGFSGSKDGPDRKKEGKLQQEVKTTTTSQNVY
jgi:hypothetical protein